jgi:hypothetical protein
LQAELQAELQKRLQQYNYYRDKLLSFNDLNGGGYAVSVEWKKLGDCIKSLNTGLNPRQFFRLNTDDATNFYITIREIQNNTIVINDKTDRINDEALKLCNNRSNLEKGDVLFSGTGTIGEVAALEETPPELYADLVTNGIYLAGGGALLKGLAKRLTDKVQIQFHVAEDPLRSVARGTGIALKNIDKFRFLLR